MTATIETPGSSTDGRSLRRERNRDAVLDAVVDLFEEGDIDPAVDAIANRARVSNRSIYRYFEDRDRLLRAAIGHAMRRVIPEITMADIGVGSFEHRITAFVDHRLHAYQRFAPIARAAKIASRSDPIIAEELDVGRFILRQTFLDHFAEEIGLLEVAGRERSVISTELAFKFDSFEFLWDATNGRVDEMRSILVDQLDLSLGRLSRAT